MAGGGTSTSGKLDLSSLGHFGNLTPLQNQLAAAQQQNAGYQSQIAALQNSLSGANAYRPSYTQNTSQPSSYVPAQAQTPAWNPTPYRDALSRMAGSNLTPYSPPTLPWYRHMASGGITDLANRL